MDYQRINNLTGWAVFVIALIVYLATVAPTASFWDCGEFIACANELEVTHPPGAPLFLMLGRIFALFAFNDVENIAFMVNLVSVFSSAFTALFTCWTVTMLAKKGLQESDWDENTQTIAIMAAGVVGGLTCTFADSIWFNAVEAEVYALSSFFTAIVVWLMFKWEARADEPDNLKWILLIAYIMGLSMGAHLLNLLTIPALAVIYYFRKFEYNPQGLLATLGISVVLLAVIQYGILQYTISLASGFELSFTGTETRAGVDTGGMGLPMGTGATLFTILFLGGLIALIIYSQLKQKAVLNTVVLGITLIVIGFSSYSMIYIRSNANPPIDMNNPENLFTFLSYMKREQYGDRPLFRGPMYNAQVKFDASGRAVRDTVGMKYTLLDGRDKYIEDVADMEYQFEDDDVVFFPRMYDINRYNSGSFGYINFVKNKGSNANSPYDDKPTRTEDFHFFVEYQLIHMYVRYFFWNFVGREGDMKEDRWESGLEFGDPTRYTSIKRDNKGKNHYYFIPLLLGMLGIVWQYLSNRKDAFVIGMLFFFTGIAIIIYLNQYPNQPRERDYSYAGSFQTFAMWVGMGVLFLVEMLKKYAGKATPWIAAGIAIIAPLLMAVENWDDHTRKGRYVDVEFAKNLLNSCEENAILFTGGDNDTFPLWYVQEVEGFRTDVRVVNLELLISDWYIDQMKQPKNQSAALPISMEKDDYAGEKGLLIQNFPSRTIEIPVDKEALVADGILNRDEARLTDSIMVWEFKARGSQNNPYILRKDAVILDMVQNIAREGWKRPIYFATNMRKDNYVNLTDFFRMEGLAYRVIPLKRNDATLNDRFLYGTLRPDLLERNLTERFLYTGLDDPSVNFDEHIRNLIITNYRNGFLRLGTAYGQLYENALAEAEAMEVGLEMAEDTMEVKALIAEKQALASSYQDKIRYVTEFSKEKMPQEVVQENNLYLLLQKAQMLASADIGDLTKDAFNTVKKVATDQLEDAVNMGRTIDQNTVPLQAIIFTIQFYVEDGAMEDAQALAQTLEEITGNPIGKAVIEQAQQAK